MRRHGRCLISDNVAIFGASGGIGRELARQLVQRAPTGSVFAGSRSGVGSDGLTPFTFDLTDEASIARAAKEIGAAGPVRTAIVATGLLHREPDVRPERAARMIDAAAMAENLAINTIGPALIGKHVLPLLAREGRTVMAFLSARVGSISDNRLGGWHSYRAAKAALNMLVRNFAIEQARTNPESVIVALHPGTVDTALSEPFQANLPSGQLTDAPTAAANLLTVLDGLTGRDSGGFFAWDGERIAF